MPKNTKTLKEFFLTSLVPIHFLASIDFAITIFGQPSEFWEGNLKSMSESNPFVDIIIEMLGYFGIVIAYLSWIIGYTLIIYYVSKFLAKITQININYFVLFAILSFWFGHIYGFLSWITYLFRDLIHEYLYWLLIVGTLIILNIITIFIFAKLKLLKIDQDGNISFKLT